MQPFVNPNLWVLSGGPGSGKTTTLRQLAALGYPCVPEVARQIIQEQVLQAGNALPWSDRQSYAGLMLQRSIESFRQHQSAKSPTFADRGIPDTLCYARLIGLPETFEMEQACREYRYAPLVFLAPPWREIYETDTERKQDFAEAERTYRLMAGVYCESGYRTVDIPKISAVERAQFILHRLNEVA